MRCQRQRQPFPSRFDRILNICHVVSRIYPATSLCRCPRKVSGVVSRRLSWICPSNVLLRSGFRPSVCLSHLISNLNRVCGAYTTWLIGAARDAASVHFRPSITRTDILIKVGACPLETFWYFLPTTLMLLKEQSISCACMSVCLSGDNNFVIPTERWTWTRGYMATVKCGNRVVFTESLLIRRRHRDMQLNSLITHVSHAIFDVVVRTASLTSRPLDSASERHASQSTLGTAAAPVWACRDPPTKQVLSVVSGRRRQSVVRAVIDGQLAGSRRGIAARDGRLVRRRL